VVFSKGTTCRYTGCLLSVHIDNDVINAQQSPNCRSPHDTTRCLISALLLNARPSIASALVANFLYRFTCGV
jgi:hypothetical protein